VVRLKFIEVEELAEEVGGQKAEAALKVSGENHGFSGFGCGLQLIAGNPARYLCRYPPGAIQPVDLRLLHVGTFPRAAGRRSKVQTGTLAGTAGLVTPSGSFRGRRGSFHLGQIRLNLSGMVAAGAGLRKILFTRHYGLRGFRIYPQTLFPKPSRSRTSTNKRKKQKKGGDKYTTDPEAMRRRRKKQLSF
jgi:hypothetical protein